MDRTSNTEISRLPSSCCPTSCFANFYSNQWPVKSTGFCQSNISALSLGFLGFLLCFVLFVFVLPKTLPLSCQSGVTCKIFLPSRTEPKSFHRSSGRRDNNENFLLIAKVTGKEVGRSYSVDGLEAIYHLYTFPRIHSKFH